MSAERRLLLVRHPETEANVNGRFVGRGDAPYTALGERQAVALADVIASWEPETIWTSPLRRTSDVARAAAARNGLDPRVDERLVEIDFGDAEGLTYEETVERGIPLVYDAENTPVAPGGESRRDIMGRSASAADEALASASRVAFVTHGGVFRSVLVHALGLPLSAIWSFDIRTGQVAEVRVVEGQGTLECFERVRVD